MGVPSGSKADKKTNGHLVFSLMSGCVSTCCSHSVELQASIHSKMVPLKLSDEDCMWHSSPNRTKVLLLNTRLVTVFLPLLSTVGRMRAKWDDYFLMEVISLLKCIGHVSKCKANLGPARFLAMHSVNNFTKA